MTIEGDLESVLCTWFKIMKNNHDGKGTSFSTDIKKYSKDQLKCYRCTGIETQLPCYFPDENEKIMKY